MLRNRVLALTSILLGLAVTLYIIIALYLPSGRRLIVGVDKNSGEVRIVQQAITFLPWHRFYRLDFEKRGDSAQTNGLIRIMSKEGVPVKMNYRLRFSISDDGLADAKRLVREGWNAWLRTRVSEAVSAVTQRVPIEDFASPTSAFTRQRAALRTVVTEHLARSGLKVTAFEIEQIEIDKVALLRYKRAELRRNTRGTFTNVAVFAIDGADWELLTELMIDGRIPNIEALAKGGTTGAVQTIQPTVSPLVWATVATGVTPDRHGIFDFVDRRNGAPVDARSRMVPAVWEIAEAFGRPSMVANWWTAWPPSTEGVVYGAPVQQLENAVFPPDAAARVRNAYIAEATIGYPQVRRFLNITEAEYDTAIRTNNPDDPIVLFRSMLTKSWTDHRVAIELYRTRKPALMMAGYETTDFVNHLFAPYHPPYREGVSQENFRRYWPAVANYYSEVDRMLGEWMRVLTPGTTVIIMSAHGMRWGKERPRTMPGGNSALSAHRNPGVFIAYGPNVIRNPMRRPLTVFDVAPTILSLIGLPQSREMGGLPIGWAFSDLRPITGVSIASYQDLINRRRLPVSANIDSKVFKARLQDIGHLSDPNKVMMPVFDEEVARGQAAALPPERWGLYAHLNNSSIELKRQNKYRESVEALEKAIELNPSRPTSYLNLAMVLLQRQQYSSAETLFIRAITLGLPNPERYILDFAAYYREKNMPTRAIGILLKGRELFPQSHLIASNLGSALASTSHYADALPELERALALQPSSTRVLNNLGVIHVKKKDYARALDYWNRSLAIDPRQIDIREAVVAVRSQL